MFSFVNLAMDDSKKIAIALTIASLTTLAIVYRLYNKQEIEQELIEEDIDTDNE
jgi:hypothetical protein